MTLMMDREVRHIVDISSATIFRVIVVLAILFLVYEIRDILLLLLISIVLAAAMDPFADRLQRYRIPRSVAVFIVYAVFLGLIVLIVALIIPPVAYQVDQLYENVPAVIDGVTGKYRAIQTFVVEYRIEDRFQEILKLIGSKAGEYASEEGGNIVSRTLSLFGGFVSFLLILVISFYLTVDEDGIKKFIRAITPKMHETYVIGLIERMQLKLARWIQGQLVLAVIMGLLVGIVLWAAGIPYALIFGLLAGFLELIPVIGPIVAAIPAIIVAFFVSPYHGVGILLFYIVINQLENHILIPKIMQKVVGLHPVVVIFAMLIGAKLAGIIGILLAVPVATIVSVFIRDLMRSSEDDREEDQLKASK